MLTPMLCIGAVAAAILLCNSIQSIFFRGVCFIAVLGSLLTLLQILSKEDLHWIRGLLYKK